MWSTAREIAEGDVVIVWLTREAVQPLTIASGKEFNGRFGCYKHSDLIGIPYGSKVASCNGKGFIHVLRPTPELWTLALPHRTQILYLADIAFVTAWLSIRPGSRVIEAGTGSGSFTHSIARSVGPAGRLFSFEFHQSRVTKAREEFTQHGMSDIVTLQHRNVCKDGFGLYNQIDSVFLDLPAPWEAIPHAKQAARKDRTARICCFSPCMEQVLRTVSALNEHGFTDIAMYETLLRPHEVGQSPAPVPIRIVREKLQAAEVRKEERRLRQIAESRARKGDEDSGEGCPSMAEEKPHKRKRGTEGDAEVEGEDGCVKNGAKRVKTAALTDADEDETHEDPATSVTPRINILSKGKERLSSSSIVPGPTLTLTQPIKEVRGHTSYLTFACLLPSILPPHCPTPELESRLETVPEPDQMSPRPDDAPHQTTNNVEAPPSGYHDVFHVDQMDQAPACAALQLSNGGLSG